MAAAGRVRFDDRMSGAEGLMWRLDKDPHLAAVMGNITVLDGVPDVERLTRRVARATHLIPRLRQRVQPAPGNLGSPTWVVVSDFDLADHLQRVALPEPGTFRQLLDLASAIVADPFDRARPLWKFILVEGLEGGRAALIQKLHHTIVDGQGGLRLSMEFIDVERDAPDPPPIEQDATSVAPLTPLDGADLLRELVFASMLLPLTMARQMEALRVGPAELARTGATAVETARGIVRQLTDTQQARSPLWTSRSVHRRLEVVRVPFADVKATAEQLGVTLNTVFMAGAAAAAGAYHRQLGAPVEELRASMAISTRTRGSGANAFTLGRMLVPTGDMSPARRCAAITASTHEVREASASAPLESIAGLANVLPTSLMTRLARQQAQTVDFATSNIRAAPFACYMAGARIEELYPIGPTSGVAFNLTLMSYDGSLDMGTNIDTAAVGEPERLRNCLVEAFAEIASVGREALSRRS